MADAGEAVLPPDENRGPEILAICGSLVGLALVVVVLRIWVRAKMVRHVGADDWTIMAAMTVMFVEMMIIIPQVSLGAGRHVQYIHPKENVVRGLHLNFVTQPLCLIALCLTKVSVGLFLLRLIPFSRFRYLVIGIIVFTVLSATGNLLTVFFQCQPLALTWDSSVQGTCMPPAKLRFAAFFNSAVAVLTDLCFALLPIPVLWNVRMNWKVKTAVAAILSLGVFASAAAIVKITYLDQFGKHGDFLWDSADLTIWTTVEINVAIVAASVPCLKPVFKSILAGSSAIYGAASAGRHYHRHNHKGYARHIDDAGSSGTRGRTACRPGPGTGIARGSSGRPPAQFEMYSRGVGAGAGTRFTANVETGLPSTAGSEDSILPQDPRSHGITKTSSIFVSYDDGSPV